MGGGMGGFSSMSSSTTIQNGKRIEKTTKQQNGQVIEEVRENGKLVSKTVNGEQQAIQGGHSEDRQAIQSTQHRRSRGSQRQSSHQPQNQQINIHHYQNGLQQQPQTLDVQDFATSDLDYHQQIQRAMMESHRQAFQNPFGGFFGNGFPF